MNNDISQTNGYSCKECGTEVQRFPSDLRGENVFCSKSCTAKFYNRSKIITKECPGCHKTFHPLRGSRGMFCSNKCRWDVKRQEIYKQIEDGTYKSQNNTLVRQYLIDKYGEKCQLCGWDKINPKTLRRPVQVDHKDGNGDNNHPNNIRLICPSCHSLTENYMNLNKGNGRKIRRDRYRKSEKVEP